MPLAKLESKTVTMLRRRIKRLVAAEIAYSWKGTQDPQAVHEITLERDKARKSLDELLNKMDEPTIDAK